MAANPVADPRKMRRLIAEDPEWNLETIPPLTELCVSTIVNGFHEQPLLEELLPVHRQKVLNDLPTTVPLNVTAPIVDDEQYWQRCCQHRWPLCVVADYGGSWKRMYFERHIQHVIETFVPQQSDDKQLVKMLQLCCPFVERLEVSQLLPPPRAGAAAVQDNLEEEGLSEVEAINPQQDHISISILLQYLTRLTELHICYGIRNCGMNFEWDLFQFTRADCLSLSQAVKAAPHLYHLHLHRSKLSDDSGRVLISHLLDHPGLRVLNLSHNQLGDRAGRALGKLLNGRCSLHTLDISNNTIGPVGASSIGHALHSNTTLIKLSLRLNRLGDEGVQYIVKALIKNSTLQELNIGSNDVGQPSCAAISELCVANKTITELYLTCNKLGEAGGRLLQEGIEENTSLTHVDLRLTEISAESDYCINQIIKNNNDAAAAAAAAQINNA